MFMIAYTAWDSLQTIAQQYDADLVLVPGERLGLMKRRDQSAPRATAHGLGKRLRAGLAALQAPSGRRAQ
jgi:2-hydroxychromene-2-carboxylate isomerase